MNIDDVPVTSLTIPDDPMAAIFEHQRELMHTYEPMEAKRGLLIPEAPYQIDAFAVQNRIKDMFWRTTEEIAEAFEEYLKPTFFVSMRHWRDTWDTDPAVRHFFEEIADALHFLVEATIYANGQDLCTTDMMKSWVVTMAPMETINHPMNSWQFIIDLGLAANCLKNKPWKQTQMPTDEARFKVILHRAWISFATLWGGFGATVDELYILYCRKNLVNQFRQRTNY